MTDRAVVEPEASRASDLGVLQPVDNGHTGSLRLPGARSNASQATLADLTALAGNHDHVCTYAQAVGGATAVTREAARLRLLRLEKLGYVSIARCHCHALKTTHQRVQLLPLARKGTTVLPLTGAPVPPAQDTSISMPKQVAPKPAPAIRHPITQLLAAQPGTLALFRVGGQIWRDPVHAWGLQDNGVAGPLVLENGTLVSAQSIQGYCGIRLGGWLHLDGQTTAIEGTQGLEFA